MAVLPFHDIGADRQGEVFSAGLTEELINQLARVNPQRVGVVASTTAAKYRSSTADIDQIAREMGARLVLEGSVRHTSGRVRVTVQLIAADDQTGIWAETYELRIGDPLAMQEAFAHKVVNALARCLVPPDPTETSNRAKKTS